jgi:hypothetical protein
MLRRFCLALCLLFVLAVATGCRTLGASEAFPVFVDPELPSAAAPAELREAARRQLAAAPAPGRGPVCVVDLEAGRVTVGDDDGESHPLSETQLHVRRGSGRVTVSLATSGSRPSPLCGLARWGVGDTLEPAEALEVSRLVSVLAAVGIDVPKVYRSGQGRGGVFVVEHDTLLLPGGDRYEGRTVAGLPSGRGILHYAGGGRREGTFAGGEPVGKGKRVTAAGRILEGEIVDDHLRGPGRETLPNGTVYTGTYVDGRREGRFAVVNADGSDLVQIWKDGERVFEAPGPGSLAALAEAPVCGLNTPGWVYVGGGCENGLAQGQGTAAPTDSDDVRVARGRFEAGEFVTGQVRSLSGHLREGTWKDFRLEGQGREIVDGRVVYEGGWANGRPHGEGQCLHEGALEPCEHDHGARMDAVHVARVEARQEAERLRRCDEALPALAERDRALEELSSEALCQGELDAADAGALGACIERSNQQLTETLEGAGRQLRTILDNACAERDVLLTESRDRDRLATAVRERLSALESALRAARDAAEVPARVEEAPAADGA